MSSKLKGWGPRVLAAGLAFIGLVSGWTYLLGAHFDAEAVGIMMVVDVPGERPSLFVSDRVSHLNYDAEVETKYTSRLTVYDLDTGAKTSRRVVGWMREGPRNVWPLGPAQTGVWAYDPVDGVQILNPRDGAVVYSEQQLLSESQVARRYTSGELDERFSYLGEDRSLVVTQSDGTRLKLVEGAAEGVPHDGDVEPWRGPGLPGTASMIPLPEGGYARLAHNKGDPQGIMRFDAGGDPLGERYTQAYFVQRDGQRDLVASDPTSAFIVHAASLQDDAAFELSRVRFDTGERMWTTAFEDKPRLHIAHLTDELLCVAGQIGGDFVLLGYEVDTGALRYRTDLD